MKHFIKDNIYYIVDNDKELLSIKLSTEVDGNQIVITTNNEVYAGPISLISFTTDKK